MNGFYLIGVFGRLSGCPLIACSLCLTCTKRCGVCTGKGLAASARQVHVCQIFARLSLPSRARLCATLQHRPAGAKLFASSPDEAKTRLTYPCFCLSGSGFPFKPARPSQLLLIFLCRYGVFALMAKASVRLQQ